MGRNVVSHLGGSHPTVSLAHDAEGLLLQLLLVFEVPTPVIVKLRMAAESAHCTDPVSRFC